MLCSGSLYDADAPTKQNLLCQATAPLDVIKTNFNSNNIINNNRVNNNNNNNSKNNLNSNYNGTTTSENSAVVGFQPPKFKFTIKVPVVPRNYVSLIFAIL